MPAKYSYERGMKKSKIAPAFEMKRENPYGLKHMMPEEKISMNNSNKVQMKVESIESDKGELKPAIRKLKPWKPMGRK